MNNYGPKTYLVWVFLNSNYLYYTIGRTATCDQFSSMDGLIGTCAEVTNLDPMLACGESALCTVQCSAVKCSAIQCSAVYFRVKGFKKKRGHLKFSNALNPKCGVLRS